MQTKEIITCTLIQDLIEIRLEKLLPGILKYVVLGTNMRKEQEIENINANKITQFNTYVNALSSCKHLVFSERGNIQFITVTMDAFGSEK